MGRPRRCASPKSLLTWSSNRCSREHLSSTGLIARQSRSTCCRRSSCSSVRSRLIFETSAKSPARSGPPFLPHPLPDVLDYLLHRGPRAVEPGDPQLEELGLVLLR